MKHHETGNFLKRLRAILKAILLATGTIFVVMIILAFTSAPFWTWYGMGIKKAGIHRPPDYIILLGGGGMPSESGLMRTWYTARAAGYFTRAKVIIALPGDTSDPRSAINLMKEELILRGIAPHRILLEDSGTNTRSQAMNIFNRISNIEYRTPNIERNPIANPHSSLITRHPSPVTRHPSPVTRHPSPVTRHSSLLLITSPSHLYRSVLTFEKAGFKRVQGLPAFEQAIESDITFNARKLGGRKYIPDIGNSISLRYQFWTQMNYELLILREYAALGYYKLMGWI